MSRIEQALEKAAKMRSDMAAEEVLPLQDVNFQEAVANREQTEWYESPAVPAVDISNPYLVSVNSPSSQVAEEYRKLKSIIVRLTRSEEFMNTLMVTSSLGGEGKSITALNLATSLAQECDNTVLLIDADLRKPCLHRYLGLEPGPGLADCLVDGTDVGSALIKTGIGRLSFLPSGRSLENPAEMLSSQKMRNLLSEMKHRYPDRYLIIDTPPVLPVAETRSLSPLVDGVVFVIREGVPSLADVSEACASLGVKKVIGAVYNDAVLPIHGRGYRYYYEGYGMTQVPESTGNEESGNSATGLVNWLFRRFRGRDKRECGEGD